MVNGNIKILLQGHIPVTSLLTHLRPVRNFSCSTEDAEAALQRRS